MSKWLTQSGRELNELLARPYGGQEQRLNATILRDFATTESERYSRILKSYSFDSGDSWSPVDSFYVPYQPVARGSQAMQAVRS